ncbi:MAG TPA: response regulator transcription factor [bacterium]
MAARILVVDDEQSIAETVKYNLEKAGFRVSTAADGPAGVEACRRDPPDLLVLDLMLPGMDGFDVCRLLKQEPKTRQVPILVLSVKSEDTDKVVGLELGADDYLTKPFSPRELVARVKAILRRYQEPPPAGLAIDDLRVDWERHLVTIKQRAIELTPKEFGVLRALVEAKGRVLNREFLLERVWGYDRAVEIETRTVDLHVSQLRKKLGRAGSRILTVKNVGYRFATES